MKKEDHTQNSYFSMMEKQAEALNFAAILTN